jgi:hypothetical protein
MISAPSPDVMWREWHGMPDSSLRAVVSILSAKPEGFRKRKKPPEGGFRHLDGWAASA